MLTRLINYTEKYINNYKKEVVLKSSSVDDLLPYYKKLNTLIGSIKKDLKDIVSKNVHLTLTTTFDIYLNTLKQIVADLKKNSSYYLGSTFTAFNHVFHKSRTISMPDLKKFRKSIEEKLIPTFKKIKEETYKNPHKVDIKAISQLLEEKDSLPVGYAMTKQEYKAQQNKSNEEVEVSLKDNRKDGKEEVDEEQVEENSTPVCST